MKEYLLTGIIFCSIAISCQLNDRHVAEEDTLSNFPYDSLQMVGSHNQIEKDTLSYIKDIDEWVSKENSDDYQVLKRFSGDTLLTLYYSDSIPKILVVPTYEDSGEEFGNMKFYFKKSDEVILLLETDMFKGIEVLTKDYLFRFSKNLDADNWRETKYPNKVALNSMIEVFKEEMLKGTKVFPEFEFPY